MPKVPAPTPTLDPDFDELDELLAEAVAESKEAKVAADAKKRLQRGGRSAAEVAEDLVLLREWELRHLWEAKAQVLVLDETHCDCGQVTRSFHALMVRQQHKQVETNKRWLAITDLNDVAGLPQETALRLKNVPFCGHCCVSTGWLASHSYTLPN